MKKLISVMLIGAMMALSVPKPALANGCGGGGGGGAERRAMLKILIATAWNQPPVFIFEQMIKTMYTLYIMQWNYMLFFPTLVTAPGWAAGMETPPKDDNSGFFSSRFEPTSKSAAPFVRDFLHPPSDPNKQFYYDWDKGIFVEMLNGGFEKGFTGSTGSTNLFTFSPYAQTNMTGLNHFGGISQTAETPANEPPSERDMVVSKAVAAALKNPKAMRIALQFGSQEVRDALETSINEDGVSFFNNPRATIDTANQNAAKPAFKMGIKIQF